MSPKIFFHWNPDILLVGVHYFFWNLNSYLMFRAHFSFSPPKFALFFGGDEGGKGVLRIFFDWNSNIFS